MDSRDTRAILPDPPLQLKRLSLELQDRIRERIRREGPLPFSDYMEMALYEPGLGYYSAGLEKLGAGGDFVTAPELGDLFAGCLSRQVAEIAGELGACHVLEIGAGSGRLAASLLQALRAECPPQSYRILERSADLKAVQRRTIKQRVPWAEGRVEWLDTPPAKPWQGIIVANEVLDALPVERFEVTGQDIARLYVQAGDGGFAWHAAPAPGRLRDAVRHALGPGLATLPAGYRSEICTLLPGWLDAVTERLERGVALFIDYGYPRSSYYLPERRDGTLICHYRQRAHGDPFAWPGLQDISAFVDFTALAEAAEACGLECAGYTTQAMFLFGCGLERLAAGLDVLPDRERIELAQEIRQLTLPGIMGEKFQCMALARGYGVPLGAFAHSDLRGRL